MRQQQDKAMRDVSSRFLVGLLILAGALFFSTCIVLASTTSVTAEDIHLGEELNVTATHNVVNMTSGWMRHRLIVDGPGTYHSEITFVTEPGSHTFTSPVDFPTPTDAGIYTVTFQYEGKMCFWILGCWWSVDEGTTYPVWTDTSVSTTAFTVTGGTPPTITCPGDITTVTDPGVCGAVVTWPVTGAGDPEPTVTCTPASGSFFPQGTTTVTCTATNEFGSASCSFQIVVSDNQAPLVHCPESLVLNCDDPANEAAYAAWLAAATVTDICDPSPSVSNDGPAFADLPIGCSDGAGTFVTWTATDASGNSSTCSSTVKLVDTTPPELSIAVSPSVLWPANHKMIDIVATVTVLDNSDPSPTVVLESITSSEPAEANAGGDGRTEPDIQDAAIGTADFEFLLRAERQGAGEGRTYMITYSATDSCGNTQVATAEVIVPHNRSH